MNAWGQSLLAGQEQDGAHSGCSVVASATSLVVECTYAMHVQSEHRQYAHQLLVLHS